MQHIYIHSDAQPKHPAGGSLAGGFWLADSPACSGHSKKYWGRSCDSHLCQEVTVSQRTSYLSKQHLWMTDLQSSKKRSHLAQLSHLTDKGTKASIGAHSDLASQCALSRFRLFGTPWTLACQVPLSMGFSRWEYWSGLPYPPPGNLPDSRIKTASPALQVDSLSAGPSGSKSIQELKSEPKSSEAQSYAIHRLLKELRENCGQ